MSLSWFISIIARAGNTRVYAVNVEIYTSYVHAPSSRTLKRARAHVPGFPWLDKPFSVN